MDFYSVCTEHMMNKKLKKYFLNHHALFLSRNAMKFLHFKFRILRNSVKIKTSNNIAQRKMFKEVWKRNTEKM